jgi:simple sugar transport system substrate-binding protein
MSKRILIAGVAAAALLSGSVGGLMAADKPVIATVVKISGIPWFDRMNTGVEAFQKATPTSSRAKAVRRHQTLPSNCRSSRI